MPLFRRLGLCLAVMGLFTARASGQAFNLRDLLTDFLREGITLAPPTAPFPSHEAHFSGIDSEEFHALEHMSDEIGNQLSNFPLASSAGGFTYRFDPSAGVFTRTADSFGPVYAERAESIGVGKFNLGLSYSHFTYDRLHNLRLRDGDLRLVFTHEDINHDGSNLQPFFEGDVITGRLFLKIGTDVTAFVLTYGLTDRADLGLAVPIVRVRLEARTDLQIQRLATGSVAPDIHRFANGRSTDTVRQSGSASGVGDVIVRGKYQLLRADRGGLALAADVRLPTGDERELLGSGSTRVKAFLIGSLRWGTFSPHVNAGYNWNLRTGSAPKFANQIGYAAGFDWAAHSRLTFAADVIGSSYRNATVLKVTDETFQANTNPNAAQPPTIVTATYPMLTIHEGRNYTALLGSLGAKINPFGNFLLTVNGLFPLKRESLQDDFAALVAIDYSF
jgi:hypothetical protein